MHEEIVNQQVLQKMAANQGHVEWCYADPQKFFIFAVTKWLDLAQGASKPQPFDISDST